MTANVMLQEAIDAIHQGQAARARDLLTRLLRVDQRNPDYWLWMSAVVDSPKERLYCLQTLLRLDPTSQTARLGLAMLGELPPGIEISPVPLVRRSWQVAQVVRREPGLKGLLHSPAARLVAFIALSALVVLLIFAGISGSKGRKGSLAAARPTSTPGPAPTFTQTPTNLPNARLAALPPTPTPTFAGPTPLWFMLPATYTPTPNYVATPHAVSEAYQIAMRAYNQGKWQLALDYLRQASQAEPQSADLRFHMGEIHRFLGQYKEALAAYEAALRVNPNFAPAYLGRARASLALNPQADTGPDLQHAVEADPFYAEAWLEKAAYLISHSDFESALHDLQEAEKLVPGSASVPLLRAQLALQQGDAPAALQQARQALELDQTSLPAFLAFGHASLLNGELPQAIESLATYLTFLPYEPSALVLLGRAYFETGQDYPAAIEALDRALALDEELTEAYLVRGLSHLALGQGQNAVNDLVSARRASPSSFQINLGLARALLATNRLKEARDTFNLGLKLAEEDQERGAVYYWRAQTLELLGSYTAANEDWKALLALPEDAVPLAWSRLARIRLSPTPTPVTPTPTPTKRPTRTPITPTSTRQPTRTPVPPTPTITRRASSTPTPTPITRTPTRTPAPTSTRQASPTPTVRTPTPTR